MRSRWNCCLPRLAPLQISASRKACPSKSLMACQICSISLPWQHENFLARLNSQRGPTLRRVPVAISSSRFSYRAAESLRYPIYPKSSCSRRKSFARTSCDSKSTSKFKPATPKRSTRLTSCSSWLGRRSSPATTLHSIDTCRASYLTPKYCISTVYSCLEISTRNCNNYSRTPTTGSS